MPKFNVEIREHLARIVTVEAPDELTAEDKIREMYTTAEIVLDSNDHYDTEIETLEDEIPDDFPVDVTINE